MPTGGCWGSDGCVWPLMAPIRGTAVFVLIDVCAVSVVMYNKLCAVVALLHPLALASLVCVKACLVSSSVQLDCDMAQLASNVAAHIVVVRGGPHLLSIYVSTISFCD